MILSILSHIPWLLIVLLFLITLPSYLFMYMTVPNAVPYLFIPENPQHLDRELTVGMHGWMDG